MLLAIEINSNVQLNRWFSNIYIYYLYWFGCIQRKQERGQSTVHLHPYSPSFGERRKGGSSFQFSYFFVIEGIDIWFGIPSKGIPWWIFSIEVFPQNWWRLFLSHFVDKEVSGFWMDDGWWRRRRSVDITIRTKEDKRDCKEGDG